MAVHITMIGVTFLSHLDISYFFQLQNFAIVGRADNDFAEFFRGDQTAGVLHRVLVSLVGVLTERTGCRFDVLFCQHLAYICRDQFVLCHHIRFHPNTHTVISPHDHHVSHALDSEYRGFKIDTDVVGKELLVVSVVGTVKRKHLQDTGLTLGGGDTYLRYFGRQLPGCFRDTVLHVDCCHIGVCALLEVNLNNSQTCIGGTRTDIHHVFHTVDTLFQGHDDTVHHCLGISTGIAGSHIYRRRCNIGILLHGQREE